ncbi:MAG TPA: copper chaperone PCu(A)C [Streptosporangiaceae bacterium]|nr:copper chaperone PCu(A)C [Streptosporangiaceae bacterium]
MARRAGGLIVAVLALAGCGEQHAPARSIQVTSAYVMQGNGTKAPDGYLVIANSGPADQLLAVRSSAGGRVLMLGPHSAVVPAAAGLRQLTIPGHRLTRFNPTGMHLEILHSGPLHQGTYVALTLVFAHAGTLHILAQVNNPQTASSGYFGL